MFIHRIRKQWKRIPRPGWLRQQRPGPAGHLDAGKGVIHIGAHRFQEAAAYERLGSEVIWIEANPDFQERDRHILEQYPAQTVLYHLVSDTDDKVCVFHVSDNDGASSSLLELHEHKLIWPDVDYCRDLQLKSKTLDTILRENDLDPARFPNLVMDTQGSELMILKGSTHYLEHCRTLILEAPNFESYRGCPQVPDFDRFLQEFGFERKEMFRFAGAQGKEYFDVLYQKS